ncbi:hypothetical protein D3C84_765930 [compost metagenome]
MIGFSNVMTRSTTGSISGLTTGFSITWFIFSAYQRRNMRRLPWVSSLNTRQSNSISANSPTRLGALSNSAQADVTTISRGRVNSLVNTSPRALIASGLGSFCSRSCFCCLSVPDGLGVSGEVHRKSDLSSFLFRIRVMMTSSALLKAYAVSPFVQ